MTDNPQPHSPSKTTQQFRHAITQILTPRDLQTNATQFPTSQDLQIRARSSPNHIPSLATRILHPETNRKAHYSPKTCDPNHVSDFEDYHKIKNREHKFHQKKKKIRSITSNHQIENKRVDSLH